MVLYNSDLSEMIEEHYADVLAELNPPDVEGENDDEGD